MSDLVTVGSRWPSDDDAVRLARYEQMRKYLRGLHQDAFRYLGARCETDKTLRRKIYIILNYPGLISRKFADFLVGEPPIFKISSEDELDLDQAETVIEAGQNSESTQPGDSSQRKLQSELAKFVRKNRVRSMLYEAELTGSSRGDKVYRLRDDGSRIVLEEVRPSSYFVVLDPDDERTILRQAVIWVRKADNGNFYLRVEEHAPGKIFQSAFLLAKPSEETPDQRFGVLEEVDLSEIYGDSAPQKVADTGLDFPTLWHVPNFREGGEFWGISDYDDLTPIFEALNNRASKVDSYLDKHSRPLLVGYPGMGDQDGNMSAERDYMEPPDPETAKVLPRYATWDGQMASAFKEVDELLRHLSALAELPLDIFGRDGLRDIESAEGMKLRFASALAKVSRKRGLADDPLRQMLWAALMLNHKRYEGPDPTGYQVDIEWQDGIPTDFKAAVEAEVQLVGAELSSRQSSLERLLRLTPQQAQAELSRLRAEQESAKSSTPRETPGQTGGGSTDVRGDQSAEQLGGDRGELQPGAVQQQRRGQSPRIRAAPGG